MSGHLADPPTRTECGVAPLFVAQAGQHVGQLTSLDSNQGKHIIHFANDTDSSVNNAFVIGPYRFTATDAARTFGVLGPWWFELGRHLDAKLLEPIGDALAGHLTAALGRDRDRRGGLVDELAHLGSAAAIAVTNAWAASTTESSLAAMLDGLSAGAAVLRRAGELGPSAKGAVAQLNRSGGGVPKTAVPSVAVGYSGVEGDRQRVRFHHGRPWQGLCLWSQAVIDGLTAEGHPIAAGTAGENVTMRGIPWDRIRPGVQLRIGEVLCEASLYALPCAANAQWFSDRQFSRIHHDRGPVSRMYATVLEPGRITVGDEVILEPDFGA